MKKQELKAELDRLTEENAKLVAELKSNKSSLEYARSQREAAEKELSELHVTLDGIDIAPGRTVKDSEHYSGKRELSVSARFTGLIARLIHRQFEPMTTTTIKETLED